MKNDLTRAITETIVRKTIRDIKDTPKRSTRNIVDMALNFAEGRFQKKLFGTARDMLRNENSAYYGMIQDAAASIDIEKVVDFGMNVGYDSCTVGARKIRKIEEKEHFNIPWALSLAIDRETYLPRESEYQTIIDQGADLGIYTWMLHSKDGAECAAELAGRNPQCAFILLCDPCEITGEILDETEKVNNLLFVVRHTDGVEDACRGLRERNFPVSVFYTYGNQNERDILDGEFLCDTETLHPVFTVFMPEPDCTKVVQQAVYEYILKTRKEQQYPTVVWEYVQDSCYVDSIISEDSCFGGVDADGNFYTFQGNFERSGYNVFEQSLYDIFKKAFPK